MKEEYLIGLTKREDKQVWIGTRPPFNMEPLDLLNSTNFRVSPSFHQRYGIVWLYEHMLSDLKSNGWKIVIDECIRLLKEDGIFVIRSQECSKLTIVEIKGLLGRREDLNVEVDFEVLDEENHIWTVCYRVHRKDLFLYQDKLWTFAMLTSGKKVETVVRFLESIRKNDTHNQHEIIISGPYNPAYEKYNVQYLDLSPFRDGQYAEISKKKNAIAKRAKNANLLIAHDRFVLNEDFFEGFEKFGYDFDFLTVKQFYESGVEYPAYCCLEKDGLVWSTPYRIDNLNQLYPTQYLNGGLLIFKTHTLQRIGFNNLLMWNQMEDVEISRRFIESGIVPRMNFLSSAQTVGVDESYTKTFKTNEKDLQILVNPLGINFDSEMSDRVSYSRYAKYIPKAIKKTQVYLSLKQKLLHH